VNEIFAPRIALPVYGLAAVAFGFVGLSWGDFAAVWQPVPATLPGRTTLAYTVAVVFLLAGLSMQWRRSDAPGALTLTILYGLGVILLHVPVALARPSGFVTWSGIAEQLALVAGGMVAYACAMTTAAGTTRILLCGRLIFGVCLVVFALAHLFYLKPTADFVPAWLPPNQMFWACATAAGHLLAGLAILSGIAARLAARLLTGMFVIFGMLVHAPTLFTDPHNHFNWAANAMNFALIASAWVIASSMNPAADRNAMTR
jgi:uncharacterized membrane protein YphA (DoxX/SURF4 family)